MDYADKTLFYATEYGNDVSGSFSRGPATPRAGTTLTDGDYDSVIASVSGASGEVYLEELEGILLQRLVDDGLAGVVS